MTSYQITVRHGDRYQRYHTMEIRADDVRTALREAAERMPDEIAGEADLVELRVAVDPETRSYVGDDVR